MLSFAVNVLAPMKEGKPRLARHTCFIMLDQHSSECAGAVDDSAGVEIALMKSNVWGEPVIALALLSAIFFFFFNRTQLEQGDQRAI